MPALPITPLRCAILSLFVAASSFAQNPAPKVNFPALSPAASVKQKVGLGEITIDYSRPSVKGRKIFGGLEAYGAVWRTGANTATKVSFSTDVKIEGQALPAGAYALYSIPDAREWTVIFNKVTGEWGAYSYKAENDALRVKVKPVALSQLVETFTIDINDIRPGSATLNLLWEKTRVPVKLEFDVVSSVVAQIDAMMNSGGKIAPAAYFSAAQFYYENGLDLQKAKRWIETATAGDKPPFYMLHWKAKILAKLGDKAGATAAANQSIAAAEGAPKEEYIRLNKALLASLK
jgi:hypothetical protein